MLSVFKNLIRFCVRPFTKPIWLRVDTRIRTLVEFRFQSLETKTKDLQVHIVDLEKQSKDLQANVGDLQVRIELLEQKWEKHVQAFLQATSIVVSFERELAHLKDVVFARDGASSSDESGKMTQLKGKLEAGEDL